MAVLPGGTIEGLAEVVLRVKDLDAMQSFYSDILGLAVMRRFGDDMVFLEIGDRPGQRPKTLALFVERWPANVPDARWTGLDASASTMHHFALSVSLPGLAKAKELLASTEVPAFERTFAWAGWRSLMIPDPERNVVELVALDPSVRATDPGADHSITAAADAVRISSSHRAAVRPSPPNRGAVAASIETGSPLAEALRL